MTASVEEISGGGRTVYRRRHVKEDGREILLYGFSPPNQPPIAGGLSADTSNTELRWHPFRREWSIYAAARQNRTYKPSAADDPLAPSHPDAAPTEIPFSEFDIAVFENRFPGLTSSGGVIEPLNAPDKGPSPAQGRCEVVVYTPQPVGSLATLSKEQRELLVHTWIDRYDALFSLGCKFVLPFENRGDEVGVTLHHPHGQVYGFSFTPTLQRNAAIAFEDGYDLKNSIKEWRKTYGVTAMGGVAAFAPPFARFPYEVWIAPVEKRRGPWEFTAEEVESFASLLGDVTRRYDALFGRACPYMLSLHAAPQDAGETYHFTAQFYPLLRAPDKVKYLASVEQATGVFTVDVLPERAAIELRKL